MTTAPRRDGPAPPAAPNCAAPDERPRPVRVGDLVTLKTDPDPGRKWTVVGIVLEVSAKLHLRHVEYTGAVRETVVSRHEIATHEACPRIGLTFFPAAESPADPASFSFSTSDAKTLRTEKITAVGPEKLSPMDAFLGKGPGKPFVPSAYIGSIHEPTGILWVCVAGVNHEWLESKCGRFAVVPAFDPYVGRPVPGRFVAIDQAAKEHQHLRYSRAAALDDCQEWCEDRSRQVLAQIDGRWQMIDRSLVDF